MKKLVLASLIFLQACVYWGGQGQMVYHWEREATGVQQFAKDHGECLLEAKDFQFFPDYRSWFYTEETKINVRADWYSDYGIWATYIPYPGAQPLILNSRYDDGDMSQREYVECMEDRGYRHRNYGIPEITNIKMYKAKNFFTFF